MSYTYYPNPLGSGTYEVDVARDSIRQQVVHALLDLGPEHDAQGEPTDETLDRLERVSEAAADLMLQGLARDSAIAQAKTRVP